MSAPRAGTADPSVGRATPAVGTVAAPIGVRLRQHLRDPLNGNVYALMLNTAVSSLLGITYWALAARLYSPAELGVGAAMVSTMTFLSNLAQLNLNGALARFLPAAAGQGSRLVGYSYGLTCLAALALSGGFLLLAPRVSDRLGFLDRTPLLALAFALSVAGWCVFTLQDSVLTALRGVVWVPIENTVFGLLKIALLVLLAGAIPSLGIFVSWNLAVIAALVPINVLVFRRLLPRQRGRHTGTPLPGRRVLARFVALDYVGYLFMQAGTNALPLIVTARLGAEANGVFYVAWLLGGSLELVAYHFGTSLTVEAAADESRLAAYARQVLRRGLLLFLPAVILLCVSAPLLLTLFGTGYAATGSGTLRLFAVAVLPKLVLTVFVAASRVQRRVGRIIAVHAATSTLVLSLALVAMAEIGVVGVGVAYLAGQVVVAGAVLPSMIRLLRRAS
ncbi:lipopolysaccharide biosynthesis protein [Micromonospora chersina]|uniref:lipopolysaccharide biosynthesis protein n=1 Tax=Micromonospora chersina TaxID=47854 RepID=UPI0037140981